VCLFNLLFLLVEGPTQDAGSTLSAQATEKERENDADQTPEQRKQEDDRLRKEEKKEESGYQRLREKAEELRQKSLPQQEAAGKLQEMLQEVQSMQEQLMDSASAGAGSANIENLPVRQLPQTQRMTRSRLDNLEDLLQNMRSENASGAFENSQELSPELRDQLSKLLEELADQQFDSSQERQEKSGNDDAKNSGSSSRADADSQENRNGQQDGKDGSDEKSRSGQGGGGMSEAEQDGDLNNTRQMEGDGFRASVGNGTTDGEEYPPSAPETSKNPVQQDKIRSPEQEQYNVHI
ncbi:MAG: DUF4175 domain-containing protein, partial [bacterium]|nr:DUF4175 domain-containing protein [bacterium]